ncbi:uncharacterized protein PADG_01014 [Paracoccidioides brasiliensis Pb18]|uniref:PARG catalytic Macro domain-containing protein n=1 Tax=Paracoccidioides brasiliensis (strain Pb18) TaxID=502780 RepID=C1FYY8_PARBD|nr:uncharacterized protein PADG_01014 [Paracoccidioides brasiliensis Pb18]EEH44725.2 hypothetical protein PADG_01014 [Paracoccidioides brasiliensis Pb18]
MLSSQIMSWRELVEQLEAISATLVPLLFPEDSLPCLTEESCELIISDTQTAPRIFGFGIRSGSGSMHPKAKRAHLNFHLTYFERLSGARAGTDRGVVNTLPSQLSSPPCPMTATGLAVQSTEVSWLGFHTGHEEVQVDSSPECYPITLITPPLRDDQVLIIQGVEAIVKIKGYGREARLDSVLTANYGSSLGLSQQSKWRNRTIIFKDALQLDQFEINSEEIADLLPGHVDCELFEAFFWRSIPEIYALGLLEH